MKSPTIDPRITATVQLIANAGEAKHRAQVMQDAIIDSDDQGLQFATEMLREAVSGVTFWLAQLEKAAVKPNA